MATKFRPEITLTRTFPDLSWDIFGDPGRFWISSVQKDFPSINLSTTLQNHTTATIEVLGLLVESLRHRAEVVRFFNQVIEFLTTRKGTVNRLMLKGGKVSGWVAELGQHTKIIFVSSRSFMILKRASALWGS